MRFRSGDLERLGFRLRLYLSLNDKGVDALLFLNDGNWRELEKYEKVDESK